MTFLLPSKQEIEQVELTSRLAQDVAHIKKKVDMLNDWHSEVNQWRTEVDKWRRGMDERQLEIKTDLKWVLRISAAAALFAAVEKLSLLELAAKLIGG